MKFKKIIKRLSLIIYMGLALTSMLFMCYIFTMEIFYGEITFAEPNKILGIVELTSVIFAITFFIYWTVKFLKTAPLEVLD